MALFGPSKKEIELAEEQILQKLSKIELLNDITTTIFNHEESWILNCQGYYDNRKRKVQIGPDSFEILWIGKSDVINANGEREDEILGRVGYAYTKSGYMPLHAMKNAKGEELVSISRVVTLWTMVVKERLQSKMSECTFGEVFQWDTGRSSFTYNVPALTWKDWF